MGIPRVPLLLLLLMLGPLSAPGASLAPALQLELGAFVSRAARQLRRGSPSARHLATPQPKLETFIDLVRSEGYHAEEHDVTTADGYILTAHRIPGGPKSPVSPNKPVVLFIHGLLAASDVWVLQGPEKDLAFMLSDAGYDLWLMNCRGNYYARRHKKLNPKEEKFWRFSWHESGVYDTPAVIDHILTVTGQQQVSIIGHSMGSTVGTVLLSRRPEYNAKVNVMLHFAPVAIFTHLLSGPAGVVAVRYGRQLQKTIKSLGIYEVFPRNPAIIGLYATFCQMPHIELLCQKVLWSVVGILKSSQFDAIDITMMPRVLNHYPQGTSIDTLMHYRQIMISGKFREFDFGPEANYIRYKNSTPPEYPLDKITVPFILYYGTNDGYTTKEDVLALLSKMPNAEGRQITHNRFSHLDFLFSPVSKPALYVDVVRTLDQYRGDQRESPASLREALEYARLAPTTISI